MDALVSNLLSKVAGICTPPDGAFNLRVNGHSLGMANSQRVSIVPKKNGEGMDIHVKPGTRGEVVHIPVVVSKSGMVDVVVNDFHIGEDCEDILIVAGCGMHNDGGGGSRHDGIHSFHIGKNSRIAYHETHYGSGEEGGRVLNPVTEVYLEAGAHFTMESVQIEGVDSTERVTRGVLAEDSVFTVTEKLMTHGSQSARTEFILDITGKGAKAGLVSRSVAKGSSRQAFISRIIGGNECMGHSECDAIIMDNAVVTAVPEITATHVDASLIHEAAIGRIAGEQLIKLMTLGLTEAEAEARIIDGFLR